MRLGVFDIGLVLGKLGRMRTHSFAISGLVCIARNARIRRGRRQEILFGNDKARCRLLVFRPSLEITLSAPHDEWPDKPVVDMAVIVLWYNVERCVCKFRCTAFDQECDASFETVAVGGGSTDDTRGVLDTMVNDGCLGTRNKGFSGARAVDLKAANGATIAFVGSDDYLASGALQAPYAEPSRSSFDYGRRCIATSTKGLCHPGQRERAERCGLGLIFNREV